MLFLGILFCSCYCRFLGATLDALKSLTKATDILRITHGTNTSFMKELFSMVDQARAEASWLATSPNGS